VIRPLLKTLAILISFIATASLSFTDVKDDLVFIARNNPIKSERKKRITNFTFKEVSEAKLVSMGLIRLYQMFISSQDISVCNFIPSCSRFGMAAFRKYGLFYGGLMTADRLLRCNGLARKYYPIDPGTGLAIDYPIEVYYLGKAKQK
jgi:putative membrane protein insertion efficiency factor